MGLPWLATGPYSITAKPRAPGSFLDTSQNSGTPSNIKQNQKKITKKHDCFVYLTPDIPPWRLDIGIYSPASADRSEGSDIIISGRQGGISGVKYTEIYGNFEIF